MTDLVGVVGGGRLGSAITNHCTRQGLPVVLTASSAGWAITSTPTVVIDASAPAAFDRVRDYCRGHRVALVECVSNLSSAQRDDLTALAETLPVLVATNLTFGHYLQCRIAEFAATLGLPPDTEVDVFEQHTRRKAHRPSASAAALTDIWLKATGETVPEVASRRGGTTVSTHEITWTWGEAESVTVSHRVVSLRAAAATAVAAASFAAASRPGLLTMDDVFRRKT